MPPKEQNVLSQQDVYLEILRQSNVTVFQLTLTFTFSLPLITHSHSTLFRLRPNHGVTHVPCNKIQSTVLPDMCVKMSQIGRQQYDSENGSTVLLDTEIVGKRRQCFDGCKLSVGSTCPSRVQRMYTFTSEIMCLSVCLGFVPCVLLYSPTAWTDFRGMRAYFGRFGMIKIFFLNSKLGVDGT